MERGDKGLTPEEFARKLDAEQDGERPAEDAGLTPEEFTEKLDAEQGAERPAEDAGLTPEEFAEKLDAEQGAERPAEDAGLTPEEFAEKLDAEQGAERPAEDAGLTPDDGDEGARTIDEMPEAERERKRTALERELERRRLNGQGAGDPSEAGSVAGAYVKGLVKGAAEGFAKGGAKAAKELATPFAGLATGAVRLAGTPVRMLGWDGITKAADAADAAWANWGADALDLGYSDALTAAGDAGGKIAGIAGTVLGFMTPGAAVKAAALAKGAKAAKTVAKAAEWTLPAIMGNDAAVRTYDLAKSRGQGDARALAEAAADGAIHFIGFRLFANKAIDRWLKIPELKEAALPKIIQAAPQMNVKTFGELVRAVRNGSVRQAVAARAAGAVKAGGIMGAQSFLSSVAEQYADEDMRPLESLTDGELAAKMEEIGRGGKPAEERDLVDKLAVALKAGAHGVAEGAMMEGVLGAGEVALTMREAREATAGAVRAMLKVERGRDFVRRQNPERVKEVAETARSGGRATAEQLDMAGLPPDMDPRDVRRFAFDLKRDAEREGDRAAALAMDGVRLRVSDGGAVTADGVDGLRIEKDEYAGEDGKPAMRMRVSGIGAETADTAAKRAALAEALERAVEAAGGREFTFAGAEAKDIAVAAMRERVAMLDRWAKDAQADSLADRAQSLADRMFGADAGVLVRRGTQAEAERAARAALGADAPLKLIREGAGDVLGMWDRRRHELVLFDGATAKTVAHELGGHALRQWAEANSPETLRRIDDYARECPESLRREIEALYPDFRDRGDAMLDEIFSNRLERELGGRFAELLESSPEALGWWQGLKRMLAEAWHGFARAFGGRGQGFGAKELEGLTPAQAMERLVERIGSGERLEGGFGGGRADGGERGMRLELDGRRYVYDIVNMRKPTLTVKENLNEDALRSLYGGGTHTGESAAPVPEGTPRIVANRGDGRNGGVPQTETRQFKAWFGDWQNDPAHASKVVNGGGEPLVVYHGTPNGKFWTFDKNRIGETWNADESGFFFTNDRKIAEDYTKPYFRESTADPNLFAVYLSIRNPLVVDAKWWKANFGRSDIYRHDAIEIWDTEQRTILEAMRAGGHDGVIINPNPMGGAAKMYMVPEPTQIKSATDNTGAFDPQNPDIRFSIARKEDASWRAAVDDFVGGKMRPRSDATVLPRVPAVIARVLRENLGVDSDGRRIVVSSDCLKKAMQGKHRIPAEQMKKLAVSLDAPLAVFQSKTRPEDTVTALVPIRDMNGGISSVVPLDYTARASDGADALRITSVYGKMSSEAVQSWIDQGYLLYADRKNISRSFPHRLQLPGRNKTANRFLDETDFSQEALGIVSNRGDGRNGGGELRPSRLRGEYMAREAERALEAIERSGVERMDEAVERGVSELERHAAGDRAAPAGLDYGAERTLEAENRGGLRIADEGERRHREAEDVAANPGATASRELLAAERAAPAPRDDEAVARPVAFSMSQMVRLYQALRQSASLPRVLQDAKRRGAKWVGRITKGSDVELNPEAFGIVDRSDLMAMKDQLRRQGHFKNEDASWNMRHTRDECETERIDSEWMLQDAMQNLADARVRGEAPGGARAVTGAMAHEIGNLVAEMPMGEGLRVAAGGDSPLAAMRGIYDALRGALSGPELGAAERQGLADAVAWWSGVDRTEGEWQRTLRRGGAAGEAATLRSEESERARIAADADGMAREAIGMFLSAPEALKARCAWAYNRIVERISSSEALTRAYGRIAAGNAPDEVMEKIRRQWAHDAEVELRRYEKEIDRPLGTKWQRAKRRILLNLHGMEAPVVSILNDAGASAVAAAKSALKAARRRGDADEVRRMERILKETRDEVKAELRELSIGVLKRQRGAGQDRDYLLGIANRVFGDMQRDGVSIDDLRTYMKAQRTIELQGRADSFGITPREAQRVLDAMRERLGEDGYARVENAQRRFMEERQRAILDSKDVRRAFGDALVSYWRSNTHYARSERVLSAEQVREYEALRREWAEVHPGKVDVLADIERLMERHRFGQGSTDGSTFARPLQGSMKATADPLAYTMANDLRILAFARRNALVMQVAELAGKIGAQGFAKVDDATKARHLEDSRRYGTIAYLEDGRRRLLVMPKVAAEGLKGMGEPELSGLVRANRLVSAALTQYNPRFAWRNIIKNRASAEINVPWMREARYVTAMRLVGLAGPARLAEHLAERVMVRLPDAAARGVAANLIWGERSNMYWMAQATRIAKMMLEPNRIREMAEAADEAWRNGDTARAQTIVEDLRIARDMMRKPIFAGKWRMATGRTDMADIDAVFAALDYSTNYGGVRLDGLRAAARSLKYMARQVAKFNDLEEYRQKIAVELAAERQRNNAAARGEQWKYSRADVDYIAATMAGSPRYEMRGRWMNMLEAVPCGPFTNVAMKGAQRTLESIGMDPAAWWTKAAARISGRLATIALFGANGYALVAAIARRMIGDDEEAQKVVDGFENCCGRIARARACVSDYRLKNYDIVPIGMYGKWGSFGINMPRGDEDTMVMPFTDVAARALLTTGQARRMGLSDPIDGAYTAPEAAYQTAINSGMLPDLQKGSMIWNLGKDMLYAWFQNPYNGFTQRTVYDKNLWDERFERSGEFFAATLKQAWNDVGGQIVLPASTWAEDEGEVPDEGRWVIGMADPKDAAEMPVGGKTIFRALHYVPFGSSIASGLFYFSVDGDRKIAQRLAKMQAGERSRRDGVAMKCVDMMMRQGTVTADYSKILDEEVQRNGWDESDRAMIEQSIARKIKAYAMKEGREATPITEVINRKMSDREREKQRAYLNGIGWKPDGAE